MSKRASAGEQIESTLQLVATTERTENEPASAAVVRALSNAAGVPFDELPPLYDVIDPDALDTLCASIDGSSTIEFTYNDYRVVITDSHTIEVQTR